ncbi:MAG: glycerate kinase [Microcystis sp. LE19-4.1E]|jgi:glycerate 2-kinase|nr:glycerate kinase [Microcystis sp. LE19-4.1E]
MPTRELLHAMWAAAVDAARPELCVPRCLPSPPAGRTVVIGAGKASAAMAAAVDRTWRGPLSGAVVTRYGHAVPAGRIEVLEASHPVPDESSVAAAQRMLALVKALTADDLVIARISGGGSSLLTLPVLGVSLNDMQVLNRALLTAGVDISDINCIRKHLSVVKGGQLAAAAFPARVVTILISDVAGDDPSVIASGPTVGDITTFADARAVIKRFGIAVPPAIEAALQGTRPETPQPDDPRLLRNDVIMAATAQRSLEAAADIARLAGYSPLILGDSIEGEARDVALVHAGIARQIARRGQPARPPVALISGGETTVTVRGGGRGGRNSEFLLSLMASLNGHPAISAISCDTDGIDGVEENAGAIMLPDSAARAAALGINLKDRLADNDSFGVFSALGDLVTTGPTLTNVNDFRAILIDAPV